MHIFIFADLIAIPDFGAGAMENWVSSKLGLIILTPCLLILTN